MKSRLEAALQGAGRLFHHLSGVAPCSAAILAAQRWPAGVLARRANARPGAAVAAWKAALQGAFAWIRGGGPPGRRRYGLAAETAALRVAGRLCA
ncbi:MAG TPA: hypothetical protein VH599_10060 [Ktedonobacterales bacterium]